LETHAQVIRVLEDELRDETGLPLTWFDALVQLQEAGGVLRMHALADRLLLSRSATTRFADRLEEAGLVERRSCPADRRGLELALTEKGRSMLRETVPVHLRGVQQHFGRYFSAEEAEILAGLLERVLSVERR
jgi:DNA-binding MarR family transcriptional regulator